ncbi:MAG: zf-HC2 domain-containing protein, partial [Myxococcota bacterium]|nr:zf-HC2 domain-containing protein [Myxococcota bacterium]
MNDVPASCLPFDEDLSALVDDELGAEREAEVREHLAGCPRCAQRLEALCDVDLTLASLPAPEVSGDLRARLAARIAADRQAVAPPQAAEQRADAPRSAVDGGALEEPSRPAAAAARDRR